jgi:hypothetical protein
MGHQFIVYADGNSLGDNINTVTDFTILQIDGTTQRPGTDFGIPTQWLSFRIHETQKYKSITRQRLGKQRLKAGMLKSIAWATRNGSTLPPQRIVSEKINVLPRSESTSSW